MELIRGLHNLRPRHHGCVATIGAFDGVHLGHQAVIRHLLDKSRELSLPSLIIVFEPLPAGIFFSAAGTRSNNEFLGEDSRDGGDWRRPFVAYPFQ